jgi:hypothetical protein
MSINVGIDSYAQKVWCLLMLSSFRSRIVIDTKSKFLQDYFEVKLIYNFLLNILEPLTCYQPILQLSTHTLSDFRYLTLFEPPVLQYLSLNDKPILVDAEIFFYRFAHYCRGIGGPASISPQSMNEILHASYPTCYSYELKFQQN